MESKITCICCPMGCQLTVDAERNTVSGNTCQRGIDYGLQEVSNPTRIITGSVKVDEGDLPLVSVKTEKDVSKDRIFDVMDVIHNFTIPAPINVGDVIIPDVAGTGVNLVATRSVKRS